MGGTVLGTDHGGRRMTLTRPRKARILEKAGLRYVAAWLPAELVDELQPKIEATQKTAAEILIKAEKTT